MSCNRSRLNFLKNLMEHHRLDCVLIYSSYEEYKYSSWLFHLRPFLYNYIFIDKNGNYVFLEIDYLSDNLKKFVGDRTIIDIDETNPIEGIKKVISNFKRIGLLGNVPYWHIKELITKGYRFFDLNNYINDFLWLKTEEEINILREGAKKLSSVVLNIKKTIKHGITERELEKYIKTDIFSQAEGLAFPISITTDEDLLYTTVKLPHNKVIIEGSSLCIDLGLIYKGLYTDMTRMFFLGKNNKLKDYYEKLKEVHYKIINKIKPGVRLEDIKQSYILELNSQGLNGNSLEVKDLGHSIGFYVHEAPFLVSNKYKDFVLKENMVFTLEPEIILDTGHRIRIEDMILCKKNSCEVLTTV